MFFSASFSISYVFPMPNEAAVSLHWKVFNRKKRDTAKVYYELPHLRYSNKISKSSKKWPFIDSGRFKSCKATLLKLIYSSTRLPGQGNNIGYLRQSYIA